MLSTCEDIRYAASKITENLQGFSFLGCDAKRILCKVLPEELMLI
jgi:hypothetical protein